MSSKAIEKEKRKPLKKYFIIGFLLICIINGFITPMPEGTSVIGYERTDSYVEFLYDLTYLKGNEKVHKQVILNEWLNLISNAEDYIILDMFLFNDDYNRKYKFPNVSEKLTNALINKKELNSDINILFITDEINNFYGVYESSHLKKLKKNNIDVVITDSEEIRDSNPLYSGFWRTVIKWFGVKGKGWLPNPFSPDSKDVTLRGYLKLLNFKANHRKVIITDKAGIVASANPHDASGYHSNIAFKVKGEILQDLMKSELKVAEFSGYKNKKFSYKSGEKIDTKKTDTSVTLITESKIRDSLTRAINRTNKGDRISVGMFYLSHRNIIKSLINASNRGVDVKLILDPNKDAFGMEKNGIPNRQVAQGLKTKTNNKIQVKWYDTHGEQYHTKMVFIENDNESIIIGGSANLTRRNIDNYNLETNLLIRTKPNSKLNNDIKDYFNRIWHNKDGYYTVGYDEYKSESLIKTIIYRIQEFTGLSTF